MFVMRVNWEDEDSGELFGTLVYVDEIGYWRSYYDRNLVYYLWEQDIFCYNEAKGESQKDATSLGIFSHMHPE